MKSDAYGKIFLWPPLFVTYAPILFLLMAMLCCRIPLDRVSRWVTTNAFSDIFKEKKRKTCCPRETKWLFKDIDITDDEELLSKVQIRFLTLFYVIFGLVLTIFWQLLVRDVNYDCDEDDLSKDCFERKWSWEPQDPLNCSSAAVQNLIWFEMEPYRSPATKSSSILGWPPVQVTAHSSCLFSPLRWVQVQSCWSRKQRFYDGFKFLSDYWFSLLS